MESDDSLVLIDAREHFKRIYNSFPTDENLAHKNEAAREMTHTKKVRQKNYINKAIQQHNGDSSKMWKTLKKALAD